MDELTKNERVINVLKKNEVDRPPVSMWKHFFKEENSSNELAESMLSFQNKFNWDFMKVNPRFSYHTEDWGVKMKTYNDSFKSPDKIEYPIKQKSDWNKIKYLDINKGVLGEHLESLKIISRGLKEEVPFVMTIFTPLSIAADLMKTNEDMKKQMKDNKEEVHQALEIITETFIDFSKECLKIGSWGIFYATTHWGTHNQMTKEEYEEFGKFYDLKVLKEVSKAKFNILHVCKSNNMLKFLSDYPVNAFNWDSQDSTNLSLKEGKMITGKAVIGGISHNNTVLSKDPKDILNEVREIKKEMGTNGWMIGPGCTFPPESPDANLKSLIDANKIN